MSFRPAALWYLMLATVVPGMSELCADPPAASGPWKRHTIDNTSQGADGTKLADVNGNGLLDITTAWEEGGLVRVSLNPGPAKVKNPWPAVTVGRVGSPEDAVFVDLDGNGVMDVVSSSEGKVQAMHVHWAPQDPGRYLAESAWTTAAIPATVGRSRWMFAEPMQVDGQRGVDLIVGSKVMFLHVADMDGDGWDDILCAVLPDGVLCLRRLDASGTKWSSHPIPGPPRDVAGTPKGVHAADINGDGRLDILMTCENAHGSRSGAWWIDVAPFADNSQPVYHDIGGPEGVKFDLIQLVDLDGDGDLDLITCEERDQLGVIWYENPSR